MINAHVSGWRSRRREDLVATVPEAQQDESLEQVAAILAVRTALRQLSPRQRAAVVLRYYDGLSVEEAAQALNCSTGTIKSQTHDALSRLAPLLRDDSPPATQAGATQ
jgi:RNA polymerase sigma factor (sigma-70 family)